MSKLKPSISVSTVAPRFVKIMTFFWVGIALLFQSPFVSANLVQFYEGQKVQNLKWTINEIWDFRENDLERYHNFIQWIFPTEWQSQANPESKPIHPEEIKIFRESPELKS